MSLDEYRYVDFSVAKNNIKKQATKVLHDIASAYDKGILDSPESSAIFANLLACICEGKVSGTFDENSGDVAWGLTDEYSKVLATQYAEALKQSESEPNIVKGPWQ